MGFHEDERIRRKNSTQQAAYNLYTNLKTEAKMAPSDIISYIDRVDPAKDRPDSKEIYALVKSFANGSL